MLFEKVKRFAAASSIAGGLALVATGMPVGTQQASAMSGLGFIPLTVGAEAVDGNVHLVQNRRQVQRAKRRAYQRGVQRGRRVQARRDWKRRQWRNGRWYYEGPRGWYYYDNTGAAVAAGIAGLAAGVIAGQALANQGGGRTIILEDHSRGVPAPYTPEWYRQCDLKYNSFRASDGTYLGFDGIRHICRLP